MKTVNYIRSEIYSFDDLSDHQQQELKDNFDLSYLYECNFVKDPLSKSGNDFLLLDEFLRIENSIFDGIYSTSYFTAYFIKFSKCGESAVIAYKYC